LFLEDNLISHRNYGQSSAPSETLKRVLKEQVQELLKELGDKLEESSQFVEEIVIEILRRLPAYIPNQRQDAHSSMSFKDWCQNVVNDVVRRRSQG